jgi:hypothetical protein
LRVGGNGFPPETATECHTCVTRLSRSASSRAADKFS